MSKTIISDELLDELLLFEFPYPLSINFLQLQNVDDPKIQRERCIDTYRYTIISLTLILVIRYLRDENPNINNQDLNRNIEHHLSRVNVSYYTLIIKQILQEYQQHLPSASHFFIPELLDLYEQYHSDVKPNFWTLLDDLERIHNTVNESRKDEDPQEIKKQAIDAYAYLRDMLRHLSFLRYYELWFIKAIPDQISKIDLIHYLHLRGTDRDPHYVHPSQISLVLPNTSLLRGQFHFAKRLDNHRFLLYELHPIIVESTLFESPSARSGLLGFYEGHSIGDTTPVVDVEYISFAARLKEKTRDDNLVNKFMAMYHNLDTKKRQYRIPLTWQNIRERFRLISDSHLQNIISKERSDNPKFDSKLYIDRKAMSDEIKRFFESGHRAMAIIGNVGIGKTNTLVHNYLALQTDDETATIWINGQNIDTRMPFSAYLLTQMENHDLDLSSIGDLTREDSDRLFIDFARLHLRGHKLVFFIDGLNENEHTLDAFRSVFQFIRKMTDITRIMNTKFVITSRPEPWRYNTSQASLPDGFRRPDMDTSLPKEVVEFNESLQAYRLKPFTIKEQISAFDKYVAYYELHDTDFLTLSESLQLAMSQPLIMKEVCRVHRINGRIPPDYDVENTVEDLINLLQTHEQITFDDVDFLTQHIVPLFIKDDIPTSRIASETLQNIRVNDRLTLHHRIMDSGATVEGTNINESFMRLSESGFLVKVGTYNRYTVEFRYEFYYDYFIGKYLYDVQIKSGNDKALFLSHWVKKLENYSFLWGPLRRMLLLWTLTEVKILGELGKTAHPIERDLIISVLTYRYEKHPEQVTSILEKLVSEAGSAQLGVAATLSIINLKLSGTMYITEKKVRERLKNIVVSALIHPEESIRLLAIQHMYELWSIDQTSAEAILYQLADKIQVRSLLGDGSKISLGALHLRSQSIFNRPTLYAFISLFHTSIFLIMGRFGNVEGDESGYDPQMMKTLQTIWRQVMGKLRRPILMIPRRFRLPFMRLLIRQIVLRPMDRLWNVEANSIIDTREARYFFLNKDAERHRIWHELIAQLDAVVNPDITMEKFLPILRELVAKDNDYVSSVGLGLLAVVAHVFKDRKATTDAIVELTDILINTHDKTEDPENLEKLSGTFWMYPVAWCLSNIPYHYIDPEETKTYIKNYVDVSKRLDLHFKSAVKSSYGERIRVSFIDPVVWCYKVEEEQLGQEMMRSLIEEAVKTKDHWQIIKYGTHIPATITYHRIPDAALKALFDFINILRDTLDKYKVHNFDWQDFWQRLDKLIADNGRDYQDLVKEFVQQFEDDDPNKSSSIPGYVCNHLSNLKPEENMAIGFGKGGLLTARNAMKDPNPVMREFVKEICYVALEQDSLEDFIVAVVLRLANSIYGSDYIPI